MIQRSDEWRTAKAGKVGCSRLGDVLASGRSGAPSATRKNYMAELVCERLTGKPSEHFTSSAMQWGVDTEPLARAAYEARTGVFVIEDGGKECESIAGLWASPDGLIDDVGGLEIKCPNTATHIETLLTGKINSDYIYQMAGNVLVYNRKWWDFVSYDPRLPEKYALYIKRFERKDLPVDEVETGVKRFLEELEEMIKALEAL